MGLLLLSVAELRAGRAVRGGVLFAVLPAARTLYLPLTLTLTLRAVRGGVLFAVLPAARTLHLTPNPNPTPNLPLPLPLIQP